MKISTHIIRLGGTLALAAFVAGSVVPVALAGHPGNAASLTKSSRNTVLDGRSPDTRDAALAAQVAKYGPVDGWYGYVVSLGNSSANASSPVQRIIAQENSRRASRDVAQVAKYGPHDGWYSYVLSLTKATGNAVLDGRSPDTIDAARLAHTQVVEIVSPGSFDWGDFGVGAGSGIGLIMLFGGGLVLAYQRRHRPQAA
jgi:hypothetical protein